MLAELLWNRSDEEGHRRTQRMVVPPHPYVHMEDVEKATVEDEVPDETGSTGRTGIYGGEQSAEILVCIQHSCSKDVTHERNTGTQGLLRFSRCIPADARQLLKPPYTRTVRTVV